MKIKELDDGNCRIVRLCWKEAYVKEMGLRIETGYKAVMVGKLAQHSKAHSSAIQVNPEVVYRNNMSLPGEASRISGVGLDRPIRCRGGISNGSIEPGGVSRGRSSHRKRAGSNCRRVTRPVKNPDGLTGDEGPNLRGRNANHLDLQFAGRFHVWRNGAA